MKLINLVGKRFGRWLVISKSPTKKANRPAWECLCDCGNTSIVRGGDLRNGSSSSCGCATVEAIVVRSTTHGRCKNYKKSRLYHCWVSMKQRARVRRENGSDCNVCDEWLDFTKFEFWALSNGYRDDLILCRNGDVGDYSPQNARWDTHKSNVDECISNEKSEHIGTKFHSYSFKSPNGLFYDGVNISKLCREQGLSYDGMLDVHRGDRTDYHGWTKS